MLIIVKFRFIFSVGLQSAGVNPKHLLKDDCKYPSARGVFMYAGIVRYFELRSHTVHKRRRLRRPFYSSLALIGSFGGRAAFS